MTGFVRVMAALCVAGLLAACQGEDPLPGQRLDLRAPFEGLSPAPEAPLGAVAFPMPAQQNLANWTHRAGNAQHHLTHLALSPQPQRIWSARIGQGAGRKHRITADPVVAGNRIFTMDSRATVTAVSSAGQVLWSTNLAPSSDNENDASGGGLATNGTQVFATSGFGKLTALDAATGAEIWTQRLGAAATSAPTVVGDTVYAVSTDSRGWAVDAANGRIKWEIAGADSPSGVIGAGAPAVTDRLALMPFHSADLVGALKLSGLRVWTAPLTGSRAGRVYARITDVTGDPVVVGDRIYAGNPGGRSMALDAASGERIWTADEGAMNPPWVAGGSVFLVSDQNELVRLDAATGRRIWGVQLPYFEARRVRRLKAITDHYGPVLAGGRLVVASGDGAMRFFDPGTGTPLGAIDIPGGAATLPAIVNGTLYVVGSNGQLHAYR